MVPQCITRDIKHKIAQSFRSKNRYFRRHKLQYDDRLSNSEFYRVGA